MTQAFSDMLYLFSCAAHGICPVEKEYSDIDEVFQKAVKQSVLPLVLMSVKQLYKGDMIIQGQTLNSHIHNLRLMIINNTQRNAIVYNAVKQLTDNGIPCCVLKGDTVANLYANPDCRISSDTDIYIDDEKMIKKAVKILKCHSFEFRKKYSNSHHFQAYHKIAGLLELHCHLHDELFTDIWFDNQTVLTEPYRAVRTHFDNELPALGITDGIILLCLHFIKHFLSGGTGVRQLMDVLLYIKKYKNEIDYKKFSELIHYLKYNKFFDAMMGIGVKYLGFAKEDLYPFTYDEIIFGKILSDIEDGGLFGKGELWRKSFYVVYSQQRFGRFKDGDYAKHINKWKMRNFFALFFMNRKSMEKKYPYIIKYGFLLPVAWLHRAIELLIGKKNNDNSHTDEIAARMDLIRELDMI